MPRHDANHTDQKTDIFALDSAIYEIMQSHEPFPELDPRDDESEILARFESTRLPSLRPDWGGDVVRDFWMGNFGSAGEVCQDLAELAEKASKDKRKELEYN